MSSMLHFHCDHMALLLLDHLEYFVLYYDEEMLFSSLVYACCALLRQASLRFLQTAMKIVEPCSQLMYNKNLLSESVPICLLAKILLFLARTFISELHHSA